MNRAHTSQRRVADLQRPDRRTQMKVLVRKTFGFVDMLWATYIHNNSSNLQFVILTYFICRPLIEDEEDDEEQLIEDGTLVEESDDDDDDLLNDECD